MGQMAGIRTGWHHALLGGAAAMAVSAEALAADIMPTKAPMLPVVAQPVSDDKASFELEGIWDHTRFAPRRTFGYILPSNVTNDGFDPGSPFAGWDSKGDRFGLEATLRSRPVFHTGDIPTRLFISGLWLSEKSDASGANALNAAGDSAFLWIPTFGNFGSNAYFGNNFDTAFPRSASWKFNLSGNTYGGAVGLQWDLRRGPLRVDAFAGLRVERSERTEDMTVAATGYQVNLGNPATLDYTGRAELEATYIAATFGTRWAYALAPAFDLIGRTTFDVGSVQASLDGRDRFSYTGVLPPIAGNTAISLSDNAMWLRAAVALGFAWHATPDVDLTLLGTASWQSNVPYVHYGTFTQTVSGVALASGTAIGFADQTSVGVRGGVTIRFGAK